MANRRFDRDLNRRVGKKLEAIRVKLGMTQAEFITHVFQQRGVKYSQAALSRMENGEEEIKVDDLRTLAPLDPDGGGIEGMVRGLPLADSVESTPQPSGKPRKVAVLPHLKPTDGEGRRGA